MIYSSRSSIHGGPVEGTYQSHRFNLKHCTLPEHVQFVWDFIEWMKIYAGVPTKIVIMRSISIGECDHVRKQRLSKCFIL
mmetsp:Transcript_10034/g.18826  ORF Transcript_10034/g.18826 Transcript_10034/m.18826 type:complete len:80 (-) Transcript_10034:128-367(-)